MSHGLGTVSEDNSTSAVSARRKDFSKAKISKSNLRGSASNVNAKRRGSSVLHISSASTNMYVNDEEDETDNSTHVITSQMIEERDTNIEILFSLRACIAITNAARLQKVKTLNTYQSLCNDFIK